MTDQSLAPLQMMLTCKDMGKSVPFYRDVLGFSMDESWPTEGEPQWCAMRLGGQTIMLGSAGDGSGQDCGDHEPTPAMNWMLEGMASFRENPAGVGALIYVMVDDPDAFHAAVAKRGGEPRYEPTTQFYGIRDFGIEDPDGYRLVFYKPVALQECQSCGMPLTEAKPGQMYCQYCTDENGQLKSWEQVFEGTVTGFFMGMQKMPREQAEQAAKEHLSKMPAWAGRSA